MIKKLVKFTAFAAAVYGLDQMKLIPAVAVLAYWVDLQRPDAEARGGVPALYGPAAAAAL